jgi:hypothetical protein
VIGDFANRQQFGNNLALSGFLSARPNTARFKILKPVDLLQRWCIAPARIHCGHYLLSRIIHDGPRPTMMGNTSTP